MRLDLDRILLARTQIDPVFLDTPQYECEPLGDALGCHLILKVETLNPVRCFKGRGTETVLTRLQEQGSAVVCASAGNLGQALAYGGRLRGMNVTVVASSAANPLENAPAMTLALRAGRAIEVGVPDTIADGVAGRSVIPEVLEDLTAVTDDAILVTEAGIVEAMRLLYLHAGLVVEPAAALGVAAILEGRGRFDGRTVATILCGSNVTPSDFDRWIH